jgi:CubicO group peptidase (beta-lactamase class C family)
MALKRDNFDQAARLIDGQARSGALAAAVLHVECGGDTWTRAFGAAGTLDAVFLLASITKPMTAAAVMILADRGALSLDGPVARHIPEFGGGERPRVLIRHLLTHTSGLPDMLPENEELRRRHAPLRDFVAGACQTPLLFSPGTRVQYQSMGILLAAEIVERVTRRRLRDFLKAEVFQPLGMKGASLGLGGRPIAQTMPCQVEQPSDWDWNSPYWRDLGSPWGGALAAAADVNRFLRYFVRRDARVLRPETAAAMVANQTPGLNQSWGLGWMVGRRFGKGCSAHTFGHSGSTGTLAWLDPDKDLSLVLLTTLPAAVSQKTLLGPVSDLISAM